MAWAAHVGGFVFGVVVGLLVRASRGLRRVALVRDHRDGPWDPTGGAGYGWSTASTGQLVARAVARSGGHEVRRRVDGVDVADRSIPLSTSANR